MGKKLKMETEKMGKGKEQAEKQDGKQERKVGGSKKKILKIEAEKKVDG